MQHTKILLEMSDFTNLNIMHITLQRLADFSRKIDKTPLEKSSHKGADEFKVRKH